MKTKLQTIKIFLSILGIFILSCGPVTDLIRTPADADDGPALQTGESLTATPPPTVAPTPTVYPPVFDPNALGDNRVLDSFILTRKEKTTGCGGPNGNYEIDRTDTIGYIKEPYNAYMVNKFLVTTDEYAEHKTYLIGSRYYTTNGTVDWLIVEGAPSDKIEYLQSEADFLGVLMVDLLSAQFVGQEDFQGIPANHFTFDQTNLEKYTDPITGTVQIEAAQGDLYVAQDGNYLLYFHAKRTGILCHWGQESFPGVHEFTEELSSINQLTEFAVPAEYLEPEQTLLDLDLPLPAGTTLFFMRRFRESDTDEYVFATSVSNNEFLEFYKNLAPTSGWTVSHIGQVKNHYTCMDQDQVCIIINNGDVQFILDYYEGGISADYDRDNSFSPQ